MPNPVPTKPKAVAGPRQLCLKALQEWEKGKTFSDEILQELLAKQRTPLSSQDRAWVMECFFGMLRNLTALDFLIGILRGGGALDSSARSLLRLGLYQLFFQRTPPHAAVNETVSLAGPAARGLVNAILRRAVREQSTLEKRLMEAPREVRMSHPEFLLARWDEQFGAEATAWLAEWNNRPAEIYIRANGLRTSADELLARAEGLQAERSPVHEKVLKVRTVPLEWLHAGLCYVQDPSTLMACDLLAPQPGETVLDLCAAPGGKATYLAELMQNQGRLVASDLYDSRLERLRENLQRLGASVAEVAQEDAMKGGGVLQPETFDRILLDAPCSNTGVLRRRVDVRWRLTDEDFLRLPVQQESMVRRAASLLKPGGTLVYSTCSLEREENEGVVEAAVAALGGRLKLEEVRHRRPWVDGVDGAFAARLVRVA